jgi:hypothetical protein
VLNGGCLCAGVRYRIDGKLGPIVQCHCSMCRKASGSAFAANASVRAEVFSIVAGAELVTEYESSPGKFRAFCSRCGSPLYARWTAFPGIRRVRLGTLDDDPGTRPIASAHVESRAPWHAIEDSLERFPAEPPLRYGAPG